MTMNILLLLLLMLYNILLCRNMSSTASVVVKGVRPRMGAEGGGPTTGAVNKPLLQFFGDSSSGMA